MVARLTVIFFIILCLEAGVILLLFPWFSFGGFIDWGDNFLLTYLVQKTGMPGLRTAVASGWVRGAVSGLGVLNIFIACWELANFKSSVKFLEGEEKKEALSKE